jgi:hypothetical protein
MFAHSRMFAHQACTKTRRVCVCQLARLHTPILRLLMQYSRYAVRLRLLDVPHNHQYSASLSRPHSNRRTTGRRIKRHVSRTSDFESSPDIALSLWTTPCSLEAPRTSKTKRALRRGVNGAHDRRPCRAPSLLGPGPHDDNPDRRPGSIATVSPRILSRSPRSRRHACRIVPRARAGVATTWLLA